MRLFVALPLPENIRWQLRLLCSGLPDVRWVPPENFHLTLRFLGEVDGGVMQDVDAGLAGVRAPGFDLQLTGIGTFGGDKVRSLWVGVEREPALHHLRDKIESAVVRAGLEPERQKFTPHVTLARAKGAKLPKLPEFLSRHNLFRSDPFPVTHFTLYSSFLSHNGPIYRAERSYSLSDHR